MKIASLFLPTLILSFAGCAHHPAGGSQAGPAAVTVGAMAEQMVGEVLAQPAFSARATPPRIMIDAGFFQDEGATHVNRNLLADRLRVALNQAAQGRLLFVGRGFRAKAGGSEAAAGAEYRLNGYLATVGPVDGAAGGTPIATRITFELIDLEYGSMVWSNRYDCTEIARAEAGAPAS